MNYIESEYERYIEYDGTIKEESYFSDVDEVTCIVSKRGYTTMYFVTGDITNKMK
jgi:hypothetical protein